MNVSAAQIREAELILGRIAFSQGEDSDPAVTLAVWRRTEGIEEGAVEQAARESADGTAAEIEAMLEAGVPLSLDLVREFMEREHMAAFQTGWIARARYDTQQREEQQVRKAARG